MGLAWFPDVHLHENHLKVLLKHRLFGPSPRDLDLIDLGWSLRICIARSFPDDANAAGPLLTSGLRAVLLNYYCA